MSMQDLFSQPAHQKSSYYNTNNESGETLAKSKAKAGSQEILIRDFFLQQSHIGVDCMTAEEINRRFPKMILTSIRRSLTNLCSEKHDKFLIKTEIMKQGNYGKLCHAYKINSLVK